ncbi:hypothetical protein DQ04_01131090 [Trypanosoma grayi]|uniref:hypothetical protein n=1 Tax=Trypanosoma grayi TaxID=71804 RepID=UPI0004F4025F|nr:hypothetical protein DQ04_01131090 [Trypanosoma grayi]KEG13240.1 hypothetical protein DQ04_01131090 [Trypanosoma grayi]
MSRRWCAFSFLRGALLAFCVLNAVLAFLFAWMMDSTELVVFRIPALEQGWDLRLKAMACRRAGLWFVLFLVLVLLAPLWDSVRGPCHLLFCRLQFHAHQNCRKVVPRDQRGLLGHKDSDSEDEELMER